MYAIVTFSTSKTPDPDIIMNAWHNMIKSAASKTVQELPDAEKKVINHWQASMDSDNSKLEDVIREWRAAFFKESKGLNILTLEMKSGKTYTNRKNIDLTSLAFGSKFPEYIRKATLYSFSKTLTSVGKEDRSWRFQPIQPKHDNYFRNPLYTIVEDRLSENPINTGLNPTSGFNAQENLLKFKTSISIISKIQDTQLVKKCEPQDYNPDEVIVSEDDLYKNPFNGPEATISVLCKDDDEFKTEKWNPIYRWAYLPKGHIKTIFDVDRLEFVRLPLEKRRMDGVQKNKFIEIYGLIARESVDKVGYKICAFYPDFLYKL